MSEPPQPPGAEGRPPGAPPPPGLPAMSSPEERTWALAAHLGSLVAAYVALGLLVLLVRGDRSPYVRHHAVESLNFQITTLLAVLVSAVLALVVVGFLLLAVVAVAYLVLVVLASLAASRGEWYRYPVNLRLVR